MITNETTRAERESALERVFAKPLWDENDIAVVFDVEVETVRHMKVRGEIPGIVSVNLRTWRVHRDAFLEHFRERGMPRSGRGRPAGSSERGPA